jgi:hypothetical protein
MCLKRGIDQTCCLKRVNIMLYSYTTLSLYSTDTYLAFREASLFFHLALKKASIAMQNPGTVEHAPKTPNFRIYDRSISS